jgi:hypothetical protein
MAGGLLEGILSSRPTTLSPVREGRSPDSVVKTLGFGGAFEMARCQWSWSETRGAGEGRPSNSSMSHTILGRYAVHSEQVMEDAPPRRDFAGGRQVGKG